MILVISCIFLVLIALVGYQSWKIVSAISRAEHAAVVPWPTRDPSLAAANAANATSTAIDQSTPTPAKRPSASVSTPTTVPNVQVNQTPRVSSTSKTPAPTATGAAPTPHPGNATTDHGGTPTPTPTLTPPLEQGNGESSSLSVLGDLISAGAQSGDPGRADIWGGRTSLYILVVGVDRRPDGGDQNADVLIIAHLDLIKKQVAAVSLPRDLLVQIPGVGADKINGSYNYGVLANPNDPAAGVAKVRDTIESIFGITLDGYVLVDFNGFEKVVDSVGGVDIDVPTAIEDDSYPTADYGTEVVKFKPGMQHMNGATALKYVRTRHADSDDGRRERQYQVLLALFAKGKGFSSMAKADKIIIALGNSIQTNFNLEQQLTLARIGMEIDQSEIRLSALGQPILQPGYTEDGRWVYTGDLNQIVAFVQDALNTDELPSASSPVPTVAKTAG